MAGKKHIYYTFKVLTPNVDPRSVDFTVAAHKWDELEGSDELPVETYKVSPANRSAVGGCSCPAWKWDCKHMKAVQETIDTGKIDTLHRWKWSEVDGWKEVDDLHTDSWDL